MRKIHSGELLRTFMLQMWTLLDDDVMTHPDGLLAQSGAPGQLSARLYRRVVGELEKSLQLFGLTVGEHRPDPGLLAALHRHSNRVVTVITRQRLSIWRLKQVNVE